MRSLATREQLTCREKKRLETDSLLGRELWIDGFNTVITLEVMQCKSILFRGMDGCVRDLASLRGTYRIIPETAGAVRQVMLFLKSVNAGRSHVLLDRPVSNSGRLKTLIADVAEETNCDLDVQIIDDVDRVLYQKEYVVTSDTKILWQSHNNFGVSLQSNLCKKSGNCKDFGPTCKDCTYIIKQSVKR